MSDSTQKTIGDYANDLEVERRKIKKSIVLNRNVIFEKFPNKVTIHDHRLFKCKGDDIDWWYWSYQHIGKKFKVRDCKFFELNSQ